MLCQGPLGIKLLWLLKNILAILFPILQLELFGVGQFIANLFADILCPTIRLCCDFEVRGYRAISNPE